MKYKLFILLFVSSKITKLKFIKMSSNTNYQEQEQHCAIISDSGIKLFYNICSEKVYTINAQCRNCKKNMKIKNVSQHLLTCSPDSPFFTGTVMCDGGDDTIVYRVKKSI